MSAKSGGAAVAPVLHRLARRGEAGRIAGMLAGCLIGGVAAVALVYVCLNCAFAPQPRGETGAETAHRHVPEAPPHLQDAPSHARPVAPSHAHTRNHPHPQVHRWTHRRHKHAHHHRHSCKATSNKKQRPKVKRKTKSQPARRDRRPPQARGPTVRFVAMPPMNAMPMPPAPAVAKGMGMDGGTDGPPGNDCIDYGPAPDQDFGLGTGWDMGPELRLEEFAAERDDGRGDGDTKCDECCYSFFDALCGVPKGARDLKREAAGDGEVALEDNEMAAV
ncbi:hypothetical protein LZ30DRAFT_683302 [Colletotrichum cereale]|nr:hypothetical protein LZ30DRAFT_683302 [Colletotrichum cereale]